MTKQKKPGYQPRFSRTTMWSPLKVICIIGLILALVISWGLVFFGFIWGKNIPGRGKSAEFSFARELRDYDYFDAPKRILEGENPNFIERRLSHLQRQVRGADDQLSVLKRRRELALSDRRYVSSYAKAAREAAESYVHSAPMAIVAAEAVIMENLPITEEASSLLKTYAPRVSQNRFGAVELGIHILAGNLENPAQAAAIPGFLSLLSSELFITPELASQTNTSSLPPEIRRELQVDEFLLLALRGDVPGASQKINSLLLAVPDPHTRRMAAEFFYDHNNPLRAAELFSGLHASDGSDGDIARAADALLLAGESAGARNIWRALSVNAPSRGINNSGTTIQARSLYNLAASSADTSEEMSWLERFLSLRGQETGQNARNIMHTYGIIRYTRLLDTPRGIAILEDNDLRVNPLLDLENLRRKMDTYPPTRAAAETWILLGRHPDEEALFEWAAWYFDHQRLFDESAQLLKEASWKGMTGSWLQFHQGLAFLREGKNSDGERILREVYMKESGQPGQDWRIPANLGRIHESRRAIAAAAEFYEVAVALIYNQRIKDPSTAALVQMRLSRCLEALGRTRESRRVLEQAAEMDPDNLNIRRELRRSSGI